MKEGPLRKEYTSFTIYSHCKLYIKDSMEQNKRRNEFEPLAKEQNERTKELTKRMKQCECKGTLSYFCAVLYIVKICPFKLLY